MKIPFIGKESLKLAEVDNKYSRDSEEKKPTSKYASLYCDENTIQFGTTDLVINNDFMHCSSELEHSFGVGLESENDARNFLAGSNKFACDAVELWMVKE